jgi:chromosome segregation ATPase
MVERTETYEIVPIDPYAQTSRKTSELEDEIQQIKSALKGAVGLSKLEANADKFISQMLSLLKSSQKLVDEVASSNQKLAAKMQEGLDSMNKTNTELSDKLAKILDFFTESAEALEEGDDTGGDMEALGKNISDSMKPLNQALEMLVKQNQKTHRLLQAIERSLKRKSVRARAPKPRPEPMSPVQPVPQMPLPPGAPPMPEGDLPPPPFPP